MSIKSLMSAAHAAGFAMAPNEEDMAEPVYQQPEDAFRNGHAAAARHAPQPLPRLGQLVAFANPARFVGFRDYVSGWMAGRAAA
jgi:hypothetical protein